MKEQILRFFNRPTTSADTSQQGDYESRGSRRQRDNHASCKKAAPSDVSDQEKILQLIHTISEDCDSASTSAADTSHQTDQQCNCPQSRGSFRQRGSIHRNASCKKGSRSDRPSMKQRWLRLFNIMSSDGRHTSSADTCQQADQERSHPQGRENLWRHGTNGRNTSCKKGSHSDRSGVKHQWLQLFQTFKTNKRN